MNDSVVRFKPSVAVVNWGNSALEFFETNERRSKRLSISADSARSIIALLNGRRTVAQVWAETSGYDKGEFIEFIRFLVTERFAIEVDAEYPAAMLLKFGRLVNFLEAYATTTSSVIRRFDHIQSSAVLIIGCGGVGSWVAKGLAAVGAGEIWLVDDDVIEASNLNRQTGYGLADIGRPKAEVLKEKLHAAFGANVRSVLCRIRSIQDMEQLRSGFDLVVNCADEPSVDATSLIVSNYCLSRGVAHIIGGGYNLHLTLAGQLVVPGKTACFNCFSNYFSSVNDSEVFGFRKLNRKRKIGSFSALCSFTASLAINNSFRYLAGVEIDKINGGNRRYEFSLSSLDFSSLEITPEYRCGSCGWPG